MKTSLERLRKATASCGLHVSPVIPGFDPNDLGSVARYDSGTGRIEVLQGYEDDEDLQCLIRTLESAEQIEVEVEELTKPEGVQEPVKAQL